MIMDKIDTCIYMYIFRFCVYIDIYIYIYDVYIQKNGKKYIGYPREHRLSAYWGPN